MTKLWKSSFVVIFVIYLVACSPKPNLRSQILDPVCEPPCWQNIIPGETGMDEFPKILSSMPDVDPERQGWMGKRHGYDQLYSWYFQKIDGSVQIGFLDEKVINIIIESDVGATLEEMLEKYGEPTDIIYVMRNKLVFMGSAMVETVNLVYPEKGMMIVFDNRGINPIRISPQQPINWIIYFTPDEMEKAVSLTYQEKYETLIRQNRVHPWQGYIEFELITND
jgi:hypothetical protein